MAKMKILRVDMGRDVWEVPVPENVTYDMIRRGLPDAEAHDKRIRNEGIAALEEALEDPEIFNLAEGFVARIAARLRGE